MQVDLKSFTKLVTTIRIWNAFNNSSEKVLFSSPVTDALVGYNVKVEVALFKDFLEKLNHLER